MANTSGSTNGSGRSIEKWRKHFGGFATSLIPTLFIASVCIIALLYVWPTSRSLLDYQERLTFDRFHVAGKKTPARQDVLVLGIDDASLKLDSVWPDEIDASPALKAMKKQWPWPRRAWANILDRLFDAGASQVLLDITFKGPSEDPENDRLLNEALERHRGKVVLGMKFEDSKVGNVSVTELMMPSAAITGPNPDIHNTGVLTLWPETDERVRSIHWLVTLSEAEALQSEREVIANPVDNLQPSVSYILARNIRNDAVKDIERSSRIRFCEPNAYSPISLFQLFVSSMWKDNLSNGEVFRGKTILIGAIASDLQDYQDTPFGHLPGVQIHAHALTALLEKSFIHQAPDWLRWVSILAAAMVAWGLVRFVRMPALCVSGLFIVGLAMHGLSWLCFDLGSIEWSAQPFILTLALCGVGGITGSSVLQLREKLKLQHFLSRYTSPQLAKEMMQDRVGLYTTLGGVERKTTMFFSDIRGFTSLSEKMSPSQVVAQLNEYLSRMVACVFQHQGLVDKFIGDAIMALWGSTRSQPTEQEWRQDALAAVEAALDMRRALLELNTDWRQRGMNEMRIGMGIHQGDVVVGNIGSAEPYEKMDLTVIGDAVNLASRLEGATKQYEIDLIISETVHRQVKTSFLCRRVDLITVKGKVHPVEIFTVIGTIGIQAPAGLTPFEAGIEDYRAGRFASAAGSFQQSCELGLNDKLTQVYLARCSQLIANPPEEWNGVFMMTTK